MDREDPGIVVREREIIYIYISVHVLTLLIFAERIFCVCWYWECIILLSGIAQ